MKRFPGVPAASAPATIIHVDMDAFYASVEVRDRPELAGRPVIVGGTPEGRGVVAAANYEARRYGVHSAMPAATARRLCPQAVVLPVRMAHYAAVSRHIRDIFRRYTPLVEPLSLDEAFLDVAASARLFGPVAGIGRRIKQDIAVELGLVASVGVATNKFLAKIASDLDKPGGFVVVESGQEQAFLDPLPVGRLWGVGKVASRAFARLGIATIGQLRRFPPALLEEHFGKSGAQLWSLAHGIDRRPVVAEQEAKSISHETTFAADIEDALILRGWLLELTAQVAQRLRRAGLKARTVQIKVRFADFQTVTRACTLPLATDITAELNRAAVDLLTNRLPRRHPPVRLLGMGVSGFTGELPQGELFSDGVRDKHSRLDRVADRIEERFGAGAVWRGGRRQD
ncbi:MAG: DNA polymerase IV [Gammaproteobacteria bacterium]